MLSVEDWAEIRRLHRAEGMPVKAVARVMGCSKNTVRRALAAEGPPRYERPARGSAVDAVGYIPFEAEAANLFFQLVSAR